MEGKPQYEPTPEERAKAEDMLTEGQRDESVDRNIAARGEWGEQANVDEETRELLKNQDVSIGFEMGNDQVGHIKGTINGAEIHLKRGWEYRKGEVVSGTVDGKEITDQSEANRLWKKYRKVAELSTVDAKQKEARERGAQSFDL